MIYTSDFRDHIKLVLLSEKIFFFYKKHQLNLKLAI
jgi:hypothetical protein